MKLRYYSIALLFLVLAAACKKNSDPSTVTTVTGSYNSLNDIYNLLRNQPKTVSFDATAGGSFYGNSGTRYIFSPNCFIDAAGDSIKGTIQISVTEYLQKGDMIFSKMLPVSNGLPLITGGEFNISAVQGTTKLFLRPFSGFFSAKIPQGGTAMTGMSLFTGIPATDTTLTTINWNNMVDSTAYHTVGACIYNGDTLTILSDSLRECNADQFMTSPNYQTFTVTAAISGTTLPAGTIVNAYALYDTYKGEWPLLDGTNGVFSEHHVPNIPVHFAVFTIVNNKFYAGTLGTTPATGANYTVTLTETDPTAFKTTLNAL